MKGALLKATPASLPLKHPLSLSKPGNRDVRELASCIPPFPVKHDTSGIKPSRCRKAAAECGLMPMWRCFPDMMEFTPR